MKRIVYYSLALSKLDPRPDLISQLEASVRSLRAYNSTVAVVVFTYGDVPPELAAMLEPYGVAVQHQASYQARLAELVPNSWQTLSQYPLLHKFLNFAQLAAFLPEQVLFLDCDTLFFNDVEILFSRYADADCYAREEPTCARSHYGYDSSYIDEYALLALSKAEGVRRLLPFNLGVVLFNGGLVSRLAEIERVFVSNAWRFSIWMARHPVDGVSASYGEGQGILYLRQYFQQLVNERDQAAELAYPSANRWILDQVSLWLALGHFPDLEYRDFSSRDVLQNGEILSRDINHCDWIVCHYFSQNMERLNKWLTNSGVCESAVVPQEELCTTNS